jgi:type III restriction enzyme
VVIFKEALATGWDCPRAEVMLSFRTAQDYTYIAQLIGRMVRTPLARRIITDGFLNTVALYLPHYADDKVRGVVKSLEKDESGFMSAVEVDSVTCPRNPTVPPGVWDCFSAIPSFTRPAKYHRNDVARLNALATLLVGNDIDRDAMDTARTHIIDTLKRETTRLGAMLDKAAKDLVDLTYQTQTVDLATHEIEKSTAHVSVNSLDIEDLFRRAKRALGDSSAKWYWDVLCDEKNVDADQAKIRVAALAQDPSVAAALEAASKTLVATWREQHNGTITNLNDAKRERFYNIWQQSKSPEKVPLILPTQVTAATRIIKYEGEEEVVTMVPRYKKHVFSNGKQEFPSSFTGWEADVLAAELAKPTLVGWYRNPTGGVAALAVPYEMSRVPHTMYPDFIFFHDIGGDIVIDIVDPHRPDSSDTGPKWTGLAKYAKDNAATFRRVVAVIRNAEEKLISLDLKNPDAATQLAKATNQTDVTVIFGSLGGSY